MTRLRCLMLVALGVLPGAGLAGAGCSSSTSGPAAQAGEAGTEASVTADAGSAGPDVGAGDADASTLTLKWQAILSRGAGASDDAGGAGEGGAGAAEAGAADDGGDGGNPNGIPGVMVCVYPTTNCTTTAADGTFMLSGLPARTDLALTLNKAGLVPALVAIGTSSTPMDGTADPIFMFSSTDPMPNVGVAVDWQNKGQINLFALGSTPDAGSFQGDPGATLSLSPDTAAGPFFLDTNNQFVPSATSFVDTLAWYYNVTPGMYTVTYGDTRNDCEPITFGFAAWGYPITTAKHQLSFPVMAGYITGIVGMLCTPISVIVATDGG